MKPLPEQYLTYQEPGCYDIDRMLHEAVQAGDVAQARTLLECGADVHSVFLPARMQVLTKAVLMHHVEMVKLILEYEDRGKRDHYWGKNTPVRLAKREGFTELIPLLALENDEDDEYGKFEDDEEDDEEDDGLSEAERTVVQGVKDGRIEDVRKGLAAGVSVENIYYHVIWYIMDTETPELLDLFAPEKWNQRMLNSGLYWACDRCNVAALHRLMDLGADAHSHGGTQAYFSATQCADLSCMKVMLERGKVDPLQPDIEDNHATAMDVLIGMNDAADSVEPNVYRGDDARDVIRLLQEYGCIEGELVEHGTLAVPCPHLRLLIAAQRGDVAAVRQALADGADVNARGWAGATALMKAARLGHIEMARLLLDHGADAQVDMYCRKEARDVNVHRRLRVTAFYQAARSGSMEMVQLLLPLITAPELRAREVSQALFPAAARGLNDMILLLLREGADINIHYTSDFEGVYEREWSPLEYAFLNRFDDTFDLLLVKRDSVPAYKRRASESRARSRSRKREVERLCEIACKYRDGKGVEENMDEAIRLFSMAADMGDRHALYLMGFYHDNGRYVPKDLEKSFQFYKQSADLGHLCAQADLGEAYAYGEGTAVDEEKALYWRRKASDRGCPVATIELACQLLWNKRGRRNHAEGFRLLSHVAADVKNELCPAGCTYLRVAWYKMGRCYEQGAGVPRDFEAALQWYRKSADAGYNDAMCRLGYFYERGIVVEKDEAEAARLYLRAAKRGCVEAHYRIGLCYLRGRGVEKDTALALRHFRRAAADDHEDALYQLGRCFLRGIGVRRSRKRALTYLRRAAEQQSKRALTLLAKLGFAENEDDNEIKTAEASSSEGGERTAQSCSLSRLWQAIEQDDLEAARSAIAQETTLSFEHTWWHFRSVEMLKLLLTKTWSQADLDAALIYAAGDGNPEAVQLLLEAGANPNCCGTIPEEASPLHAAAFVESGESIRMLLAAGAEVNNPAASEWGGSPLDVMCPYESPEPICQEDVPGSEEDMRLHPERGEGFRTTLRLLEAAGAMEAALLDIGTPEVPSSGLSLLLAAQCGDVAAAQSALTAGADVNARGHCNTTALMKAARRGDMQMAHLLLAAGANPQLTAEHVENFPTGALYQAVRGGSVEMVLLLLPLLTDEELRTREVSHALLPAAARGYVEILRILISAGADVNYCLRNYDGYSCVVDCWSVYRYAFSNNHWEALRLLLDSGARACDFFE